MPMIDFSILRWPSQGSWGKESTRIGRWEMGALGVEARAWAPETLGVPWLLLLTGPWPCFPDYHAAMTTFLLCIH